MKYYEKSSERYESLLKENPFLSVKSLSAAAVPFFEQVGAGSAFYITCSRQLVIPEAV